MSRVSVADCSLFTLSLLLQQLVTNTGACALELAHDNLRKHMQSSLAVSAHSLLRSSCLGLSDKPAELVNAVGPKQPDLSTP